jgi:hypothetical protein
VRDQIHPQLEDFRCTHSVLGSSPKGTNYGYFELGQLRVISSGSDDRWEHVSVSCPDRCPTWEEMASIKAYFWSDDETVLQFHPRRSAYVSVHPYCLHLWKQRRKNHPLPPRDLI